MNKFTPLLILTLVALSGVPIIKLLSYFYGDVESAPTLVKAVAFLFILAILVAGYKWYLKKIDKNE